MTEIVNFHYLLLNKIEKDSLAALQKLSPDTEKYSNDELLGILFYNYRIINGTPKGLRLTSFGSKIMSKHFQSYKYAIDDEINNMVFVGLDKAMKWPYYLGTKSKHVVFYSEEDAAWFRLNGNNIKNYIESI